MQTSSPQPKTSSAIICSISEELQKALKQFRFSKSKLNSALIMKINKEKLECELEDSLNEVSLEDLAQELPDTQPRFVMLSYAYKRDGGDGRVSYPLIFFYYSPVVVKPETHMLYAGAKSHIVQQCDVGKVYDIRDTDCLNDQWLREKLSFFN